MAAPNPRRLGGGAGKHVLSSAPITDHNAFLLKFLAGAFAAVPAALIPTPFDVIKTRLQARLAGRAA